MKQILFTTGHDQSEHHRLPKSEGRLLRDKHKYLYTRNIEIAPGPGTQNSAARTPGAKKLQTSDGLRNQKSLKYAPDTDSIVLMT
jgi:hypothetical protein